jgi:hypothetical protein
VCVCVLASADKGLPRRSRRKHAVGDSCSSACGGVIFCGMRVTPRVRAGLARGVDEPCGAAMVELVDDDNASSDEQGRLEAGRERSPSDERVDHSLE